MDDTRLADAPTPEAGRKPLQLANDHRADLGVVTEVDLSSHQYPISRVRWRRLVEATGD